MNTNESVKLPKVNWAGVGLGTAVREVEMSPYFAHDELLEVDLLVDPLNGHCDMLDAGGD